MTVLITIQHPAHVHFFKHAIDRLEANGEPVHVVARDNEVAVDLLEAHDVEHTVLADESDSLARLAITQATYELRTIRYARRVEPDVITGIGGVTAAHAAAVTGAESVVFTDTEHATLINRLTHPVADRIVTPACYTDDLGDKQVSYPGYHELAYLHPDRFTPDPAALDDLRVDPEDTFVVLRVSAWDSSHDVGASGFADLGAAVERLEAAGATVLVTSEVPLPDHLERCRTSVPPEDVHHLLAYADCFVGEGATMAAESAVLGTPAVYVNSLTMGYTDELGDRYDLLASYPQAGSHDAALDHAVELVESADSDRLQTRRERLLADTGDTTAVILRQLAAAVGDPTFAAERGDGPRRTPVDT
jgi:predicted glycosyltransferase